MASTPTGNLALRKPARSDPDWNTTLNANFDAIDALAPLAGLAVVAAESPPSSLNVRVLPGSFRRAGGAVADFAGANPLALPASSTRSIYLDDAGAVQAAAGWPATPHVRLAVVTTDAAKVASIVDARAPLAVAGGGQVVNVATRTASHAAQPGDGLIRCDASAGPIAVTLLAAATCPGASVRVAKVDASANAVTVSGPVNGAASLALAAQWSSRVFISNGASWDAY